MIILCTHNDGGVGKTTLAVHIAGVLIDRLGSTLLIDCDDQADLWQFYVGNEPTRELDYHRNEERTVVWNDKRKSLSRIVSPEQYDHIILDIDSPLKNTVQVIISSNPDLVLVPINKSHKHKALRNLPRTLKVITDIASKAGYDPEVIIVPLGISGESVSEVLDKLNRDAKPTKCKVAPAMENLEELIEEAVYKDTKYIWEYSGYEHLYDYFDRLIN